MGSTLSAQKKVYLDNHYCWTTNKEKAVEYAVITKEKRKQIKVEFYTLDGRKKGVGSYSAYKKDPKTRVKNGVCTYLYPSGKDSLVTVFKDNLPAGQHIAYYPEGGTKFIQTFKEGKREGKALQHYPNGNIKQIQTFSKGKMNGQLLQYYKNGQVRREEFYTDDKCTGGKLFSSKGEELEFEPYVVMPEFPGGIKALMELLRTVYKYPEDALKAKMEGRVVIQFTIDTKGKMNNPKVVSSVYPPLDKEALRIVETIGIAYKWSPGKLGGKYRSIKYTIPIRFRLPVKYPSSFKPR